MALQHMQKAKHTFVHTNAVTTAQAITSINQEAAKMGIENNECVIATTSDHQAMDEVKGFISTLSEETRALFAFVPALLNGKETMIVAPDGSKKGWPDAADGEALRDRIVELLETFKFDDGSNLFSWVEVGFGEYGQKVLRGNCTNKYSEGDYHDQP